MTSDCLKTRQKQLKAIRQFQVHLALPNQNQVRCEAGQSQGSWRMICRFSVYLFLVQNEPGIPILG